MHLLLTPLEICDLEMLMVGAFHPLKSFLNKEDYHSVIECCRLTTKDLWPVPILLTISSEQEKEVFIGQEINLCMDDSTSFGVQPNYFCSMHPVKILDAYNQTAGYSSDIYPRLLDGEVLTVPAGQQWIVYYFFKSSGIVSVAGCDPVPVEPGDNGLCSDGSEPVVPENCESTTSLTLGGVSGDFVNISNEDLCSPKCYLQTIYEQETGRKSRLQ